MFTPEEYESLTEHPGDKQYEEFFNYWTLTEAYIRARGMGLALSTIDLQFLSMLLIKYQFCLKRIFTIIMPHGNFSYCGRRMSM